jgi:tripartite-type tricarboxylate transporter receptor subunit TctC
MPRNLIRLSLVLTLAFALAGAAPAMAQDSFPTKPVRIILPLPAGSALDVVARLVGEQLTDRWGHPAIVENRPGAGGIIAAQAVASAPSDGYTLLGGAASIFTILPAQKDKLQFDVNRVFIPIAMMGGGPMYVAVSPKLGVATLPELVALAKSKPQQIFIGTNGVGTLPYFAALALAKMGNIPVGVVPYATGGTMEAIRDILGGRVHVTIEGFSGLAGMVRSGDLKLIAVMSPERVSLFPGVPAVAETVPGLSAVGWMALAAPAGTPEHAVRRLNEGVRYAIETPSVKQRFDELGMQAKILTSAETRAFIESEQKLWWPIVKEAESK